MNTAEQILKTDNGLKVLAPAKINLSLLIAGKRSDGFHELETIMAKVNLFDELLIESASKPGIELNCRGDVWSPEGPDNLVYQACEKIFKTAKQRANIKITLNKAVPAGAGLGSASTDAAAALLGVNEFLNLGLGKDELYELAAELGSDVVFFLGSPLAFCTGRGEKISQIPQNFNFKTILVLPEVNCSTKRVYANYRHDEARFEKLSGEIDVLIKKNRIDLVAKMCANMLEETCFGLYRELAELKVQLEALGIEPWCLSGSGSAMYHIVNTSDGGRVDEFPQIIKRRTGYDSIILGNNSW